MKQVRNGLQANPNVCTLKLLQELMGRQSATWEKIGQVLENSQEN